MRKGMAAGLSALVAGFVVSFSSPSSIVARQPDADAKAAPKFLYGHDLKVRPGGKQDFGPKTPRIGVEFFHDEHQGRHRHQRERARSRRPVRSRPARTRRASGSPPTT